MKTNTTNQTTPTNEKVPTKESSKLNFPKSPALRLLIGLVVLTLVVGVAALLININDDSQPSESGNLAGQEVTVFLLRGSSSGRGLSFEKPKQLKSTFSPNTNPDLFQSFVYLDSANKNNPQPTSFAGAQSKNFPTAGGPTAEYKQAVSDTLANTSSEGYQAVLLPIDNFTRQVFRQPTLKVTLTNARPFTNPYIKSATWIFDVKTEDNSGKIPSQTGVSLYSLGKNTIYYFLISDTTDNWQANLSFYQSVVNSLKVDQ